MGVKKELTVLLILIFWSISSMSQICDSSKTYIQPKSKWYLNDTSYAGVAYAEIAMRIAPKDTAIVKQMIELGTMSKQFEAFFNAHSIAIKRISLDSFERLPVDSLILTKKDEKVLKRWEEIIEEMSASNAQGKSTEKFNRELEDPKFSKLQDKIQKNRPILFYMHPIYSLNGKLLIMYVLAGQHRSPHAFHYEICDDIVVH